MWFLQTLLPRKRKWLLAGAVAEVLLIGLRLFAVSRTLFNAFDFCCRSKGGRRSSEEENVPPGMELVGLSFTSVGATDPPK